MTGKIDEGFVDRKGIGVILLGLWRTVEHGLHRFVLAAHGHVPTDDTAGVSIHVGYDVHFVFFAPMKVNAGGMSGNRSLSAFTQLAMV